MTVDPTSYPTVSRVPGLEPAPRQAHAAGAAVAVPEGHHRGRRRGPEP
jgi:hypothetical protein